MQIFSNEMQWHETMQSLLPFWNRKQVRRQLSAVEKELNPEQYDSLLYENLDFMKVCLFVVSNRSFLGQQVATRSSKTAGVMHCCCCWHRQIDTGGRGEAGQ